MQAVLEGCPDSLLALCIQCCEHEPDGRPSSFEGSDWLHELLAEMKDEELVLPRIKPTLQIQSPRREGNVVKPASSVRCVEIDSVWDHVNLI